MLLKHNDYIVKINVDDTYTIDSTDNRYYDVILKPTCCFCIKIESLCFEF